MLVGPLSLVYVRLMPPNSLAVVRPTSTAPAARNRCTTVASCGATRSRRTRHASVCGQPPTSVSSLTPTGTPPNGSETSALAAAARALVGRDEREGVQVRTFEGGQRRFQLFGRRSPSGTECFDEGARRPPSHGSGMRGHASCARPTCSALRLKARRRTRSTTTAAPSEHQRQPRHRARPGEHRGPLEDRWRPVPDLRERDVEAGAREQERGRDREEQSHRAPSERGGHDDTDQHADPRRGDEAGRERARDRHPYLRAPPSAGDSSAPGHSSATRESAGSGAVTSASAARRRHHVNAMIAEARDSGRRARSTATPTRRVWGVHCSTTSNERVFGSTCHPFANPSTSGAAPSAAPSVVACQPAFSDWPSTSQNGSSAPSTWTRIRVRPSCTTSTCGVGGARRLGR